MKHTVIRSVPFKFQIGDVTLISIARRLAVRSLGLRDSIDASDVLAPPAPTAPPDCQGFVVRGRPVSGDTPRISEADGFVRYIPLRYWHCYIDLSMTFDQYQAKFSSKTRSTIKRKISKYAQTSGGKVQWKSYSEPGTLDEFFSLARSVSKLTYQERLLDVGLPDSANFRTEAKVLAAAGNLRAYLLFDEAKPVSYLYCPIDDGIVVYAYLGYDPAYARLSVGTILQWFALEALFQEGKFRLFDFTEGQSDHKKLFATHQRECANVYWLVNSVPNRLLVRAHALTNSFSAWLGNLLDNLGLKTKVKRLLRRG